MNAIEPATGLLPLDGHPRRRARPARAPRRRRSRCCKAAGFDLVIVETPGIGQGDAGDRAVRRPLALRDDARVRCRVPAREDRHARLRRRRRDQQVRAARRRGRPPRRRPPARAQPRGVRRDVGGHAGVRHDRAATSTTTASPRSTSTCAAAARRATDCRRRGRLPARRRAGPRAEHAADRSRPSAGALPRRDRRDRARLPRRHRRAGRGGRAAPRSTCAPRTRARRRRRCRRAALRSSADEGAARRRRREPARRLAADRRGLRGRRARGPRARQGAPHRAHPRDAVGQRGPPRRAAPLHRGRASCCASCAARTCPAGSRSPPGVFPFKREGEDPARMFAGEGDAFRTNRRFHSCRADCRPSGCPPRSTRSRSTAATPTSGPTSTARSATPGSRSRRSTT